MPPTANQNAAPGRRKVEVVEIGDGWTATFTIKVFSFPRETLLLTLLACALVAACIISICASSWVALAGVLVAGIFLGFALLLVRVQSQAVVRVRPEQLAIDIQSSFSSKSYAWEKGRIVAIDAWDGLDILDRDGTITSLFVTENELDISWLAGSIRATLQVPSELPPRPGELAVTLTGSPWSEPVRSVLRAGKGEIALRHSLAEEPYLRFVPGGAHLGYLKTEHVLPLEPTDIICRVGAEGTCLEIDLADAKYIVDSRGEATVTFPLVTFLPARKFRLPRVPCRLGQTPSEGFRLSIWSDAPDALQAALGQFWGATE